MKEKIEQLEERIAALEQEVARLKGAYVEHHHYYHSPPAERQPSPLDKYQPRDYYTGDPPPAWSGTTW